MKGLFYLLFKVAEQDKIPLCKAAVVCDVKHMLFDAVAFRMNTAVDQNIDDYYESIAACIKRLENAN